MDGVLMLRTFLIFFVGGLLLTAGAISLFGNTAQRHWLKRTRTGAAIAAFALSEAKSGSDVAGMDMTATRDGDASPVQQPGFLLPPSGV